MPTAIVADDDPGARSFVRAFLESEGYDVEEAATGGETVDALRRAPPDVLVLDYHMPGGDGLDVLASMGRDRVPTVFLSCDTDAVGGDAVPEWVVAEVKPLPVHVLRAAISRARSVVLRRRRETMVFSSMCDLIDAATREVRTLRARMA